jgi:Helix-turn-helix domain
VSRASSVDQSIHGNGAAAGVVSAKGSGRAYPSDVMRSSLSRNARSVWTSLCNHCSTDGLAFPREVTIASECAVKARTVRRGLNELLENNWICLPNGDAGGRPPKDRGRDLESRVKYHLHRNGKVCDLPQPELKQRSAALKRSKKVVNMASFSPEKGRQICLERWTSTTEKVDKTDSAYKEEPSLRTISNGTPSTTSSSRAHEAIDDAAVAGKDLPLRGTESPDLEGYAEQIQRLLKSRRCVENSFGPLDKKLAADLFRQNVPIEQIEHAFLQVCARWYMAFFNGKELAPIKSLRYFESAIGEAGETEVSKGYWHHVHGHVHKLEQQWLEKKRSSISKRGL